MTTTTQRDTKNLLGALLAEIMELRQKMNLSSCDKAEMFALQNGIVPIIDKHLKNYGLITQQHFNDVVWILERQNVETFRGYYDIERQLKEQGINRGIAHTILTYLKATGSFVELIQKMDSEHSPDECREFNLPN